MRVFLDTVNELEALEVEGVVRALCLSSTVITPWHVMEKRQLIPQCQCSAYQPATVGWWVGVLPSKWWERSTVTGGHREPRADKAHDVPTTATTALYLFLADDTTHISSNQGRGAIFPGRPPPSDIQGVSCSGQLLLPAVNSPTAVAERSRLLALAWRQAP